MTGQTTLSEYDTQPSSDWQDDVFVEQLRQQMLQFAVLQLNDPQQAEDAVQEALVGALKNASGFARRAALKTWVFAILKNKIADALRYRQRFQQADQLQGELNDNDDLSILFNRKGFWQQGEHPERWQQPLAQLDNQYFWQVFDTCLNALPARQAQLFMMREFLEFDSEEICQIQQVSISNLHVMLYRARLRLRKCLEIKWFQQGEKP